MNRKERRAEAKANHNPKQEVTMEATLTTGSPEAEATTTNQEETMENIETTETNITISNQEDTTPDNTKADQPGFFTRIKNAFVAGYRAGKTCVKEQALEIQDIYVSVLEESRNVVVAHVKATVKTTCYILKKSIFALFSLIALPFIKLDSLIDRKEEVLS